MANNSWKLAAILLLSFAAFAEGAEDQLISAVECDIATEAGICLFGGTPIIRGLTILAARKETSSPTRYD